MEAAIAQFSMEDFTAIAASGGASLLAEHS